MSNTQNEVTTGSIEGDVKGYTVNRNNQSPIFGRNLLARVFLLICVETQGQYQIFYPSPRRELGKILNAKQLFDQHIQGIDDLKEKAPEINQHIEKYIGSFKTFYKNENDPFKFKEIPLGWWSYIVGACVERELYFITDQYGNNGRGENRIISGELVKTQPGSKLDGVIVPVVRPSWFNGQTGELIPLSPPANLPLPMTADNITADNKHRPRTPHLSHGQFSYQWWLFNDKVQADGAVDHKLSPATLYREHIGKKICGPGDPDEELFGRSANGKDDPTPAPRNANTDIELFDETLKNFRGSAYLGLGACKLSEVSGDGSNADGKWKWTYVLVRSSGIGSGETREVQQPVQQVAQPTAQSAPASQIQTPPVQRVRVQQTS